MIAPPSYYLARSINEIFVPSINNNPAHNVDHILNQISSKFNIRDWRNEYSLGSK